MSSKGGLSKNTLVYMREQYGSNIGRVNESNLYQIRSIGEKQATLDRVDKKTLVKNSYRGHNVFLYSKEEADRMNERSRTSAYQSLHPWQWSQLFVPIGEAGWDADMNF